MGNRYWRRWGWLHLKTEKEAIENYWYNQGREGTKASGRGSKQQAPVITLMIEAIRWKVALKEAVKQGADKIAGQRVHSNLIGGVVANEGEKIQ